MMNNSAERNKRATVLGVLLFASFALLAPALSSGQGVQSDAVEATANGAINWTSGEISARGIGAPPTTAANAAQARGMAERAAFVVAIRNLLETVKGVRVDSETVVENFLVRSDVIRTRVDGIVQGARIVNRQYMSDGSVEMTVSLNMRGPFLNVIVPSTFGKQRQAGGQPLPGLQKSSDARMPAPENKNNVRPVPAVPPSGAEPMAAPKKLLDASDDSTTVSALKPEPPAPNPVSEKKPDMPELPAQPLRPAPAVPAQPTVPAPATVDFKGGVATGVVIDGRGLGLRPALLPKIIDQQGQEVYVGQVVTRTNAVEQGVAGYARDVRAAANNFRVTDNPAVIRGMSATGAAKTDIVIAQADAEALRKLSSTGDFLQYCRVIIVY